MDAQLKKGVLEFCLLDRISRRDCYGYQLLKVTSEAFAPVQESTVYAILRRLRSQGYTETYEGHRSDGPARKYYRITEAGRKALDGMQKDWMGLLAGVERMKGDETF